jgi:hypothetical protein
MNGTPSTNPNRPYERTLSLAAACGRIGPIGGCEVTAISDLLLHRDDQIGCALFGPIDLRERERTGVGHPV